MSSFWMGFILGIVSVFGFAMLAVLFKGSYLMMASQRFYGEVMRRKNARSNKLIVKQLKKKK